MAMLTVRLDAKTESAIGRLKARTGKTKSQIIRDALECYGESLQQQAADERPYEKIKDLIGSCDSGGLQLSAITGVQIAEMMRRDFDARRTNRHRTTRRAR